MLRTCMTRAGRALHCRPHRCGAIWRAATLTSQHRTVTTGTIDIERALVEGVKAFEPGLLARAHRGILYVDEVNLLEDNLVDVVLDSAASGINTVEREGVSLTHPAKFILVGSGNPAEGEMRPQLLDRFGLQVNVGTLVSSEERLNMVRAICSKAACVFALAACA